MRETSSGADHTPPATGHGAIEMMGNPGRFERIGIFTKREDPRVGEPLARLVRVLLDRRVDVVIDPQGAELLGHPADLPVREPPFSGDRDLVVVVGGDGALLRAAQVFIEQDVRMLGVNVGRLGFLTDLSPAQLEERLAEILDGHYIEERRFFLHCSVWRGGVLLTEAHALNDVVVEKWNTARLISFEVHVGGRYIYGQRSDGLIVATPTGSTAYALSAGGPILHPALEAIVLVPLNPHTLTHRPIVVDSHAEVEVAAVLREPETAHVTCDGESIAKLSTGDRVRARRTDRRARLIHPADHDHYAVLRAKLHWGTDLC